MLPASPVRLYAPDFVRKPLTRSARAETVSQGVRDPERMEFTPVRNVNTVSVQPEHSPAAAGTLLIHQERHLSEEIQQPALMSQLPEHRA